MRNIPWGRVAVGGAAAGFLYNLGGIMSAWLIALPQSFARLGVEPSTATALLHLSLRFGLGFASVLLYMGARQGWGRGARTAARIGLAGWFIGYVPGSAVLHELGVLTSGQLLFALPWGLAEAVAATLLGAWCTDPTRRGARDA